MKVYNKHGSMELTENLKGCVERLRSDKAFNAEEYVDKKTDYLNKYMKKCGLNACVVAISGGIDSAIVLGLVVKASKKHGSPIKKIVPIMLPALENVGVTNQSEADNRGKELCMSLGVEGYSVDINPAVNKVRESLESQLGMETDEWAIGQLCPYTRTPFLYYTTSLLVVGGFKPILVGTTNRDEGAYLGYIGKASDGMVDVQLISDIHKSEVYSVARELNIVSSILNVTPAGDMYDDRCDTDVFGAPYDFVELFLDYLNKARIQQAYFHHGLDKESNEQFNLLAENLDNLHKYNRHKYIAHSPAVHLDLWDCSCPDGWINYYELTKKFMEEKIMEI